mgnify:CR=1 FL=1
MAQKPYDTVRVNIQLPLVLKEEIEGYARAAKESVSEFFRIGALTRIDALRRAEQERRLVTAYEAMREARGAEGTDWVPVDLEGWE